MLEYVFWSAFHFGAWGLMLLAAAGAGHIFLRKTTFHSVVERCVFTLALGLGVWALALFCLGLAGALYQEVILGLTSVSAAGTILYLVRLHKRSRPPFLPYLNAWREQYRLLGISLGVLAAAYWVLLLFLTQYPPVQWDATSNHLVLARAYLEQHRIVPVMGVAQPVLPALNHMLFAWSLAMRDDILSQMMEHTLLMLVALGIYASCASKPARENWRLFGLAAACLWLAHPIVIWFGRAAYTDVGVTCFAFLGVYALRRFWNDRGTEWWYLSMSMLGLAAATKLTGLFFLALGGCVGLLMIVESAMRTFLRRKTETREGGAAESRPMTRSIVLGWTLALLIAMPWYGFIAYETGNPVWPVFAGISRGVWGTPEVQTAFAGMLNFAAEPRTLENFLKLPFDWRYHSDRFGAEVTSPPAPLMLIWMLAWIVGLWSSSVRWWAAWALAFTVFWFFGAQQIRYWMPALPMAGLALYESFRWVIERVSKSVAIHSIFWTTLILYTIAWGSNRIVSEAIIRGVPPVTASQRQEFLARSYPGISAVKFINDFSSREETICVIGGSWLNYYFQPRVLDMVGPLYTDKRPAFGTSGDPIWMEWLELNNAAWIFIDHVTPQGLTIPNRDGITSTLVANYQLVFADAEAWVLHRIPIPPGMRVNLRGLNAIQDAPSDRAFANSISLARASSPVSIRESKSILSFRLSASRSNPSPSIPVIITPPTDCRPNNSQ